MSIPGAELVAGVDVPASGFAEGDGLRVFYQCFGSGPPMLLAHGWGADARTNWIDTGWIDALRGRRMVIAIDVRGHGRSDKPHARAPYGYGALSNDVLTVMDALEIDRADYLGYSMGAFMGAWLLGHAPERFSAMVLGGIGDESENSAAQGAVVAAALRQPASAAGDRYAAQLRAFVAAVPGCDLEALACSAEQMWPEGYPLRLIGAGISDARLPVLIVNGSEDHPYVDSADAFAAALPDARHVQLAGADHLSAVTHPDFKRLVLEYLDGPAAAD